MKKKCGHKIVILTGVDRVGKSSIWQEINSQTKYKHFIIDRFTEGFKAYKELYNKPDELCNLEELEIFERAIKSVPHILIHLECSTDELKKRCIETGHELYDIELNKNIYKKYVELSTLNKVTIDTTGRTAKDVVKELVEKKLV